MLDFLRIKRDYSPKGKYVIYPDFNVESSCDLMTRGHDFYAVWNSEKNVWSLDEYDVAKLVDKELWEYYDKFIKAFPERAESTTVKTMKEFSSGMWMTWKKFTGTSGDHYVSLDSNVTFLSQQITKEDYASKRLPYDPTDTPTPCYDELMEKLYSKEEREKLEWAIGSIFNGDSKKIQKFIVLYGGPGTGKGTVIDIIQMLFPGYFGTFEAKELGQANNTFALESLRDNPLVAIQTDGNLSRISDNTKLNTLISHEFITMKEKFKPAYKMRFNSFLFIGTNNPVAITDSKSGILRRLIDVSPTGNKFPQRKYDKLKKGLEFELGGIAHKCISVYEELGYDYYNSYRPQTMMYATNDMYNFVEDCYDDFQTENQTTLRFAWTLYKKYCEDANVGRPLTRTEFREELKSYFAEFDERRDVYRPELGRNTTLRSVYTGFLTDKFDIIISRPKSDDSDSKSKPVASAIPDWLILKPFDKSMNALDNVFNSVAVDYPAQPAKFSKKDGKDSPKTYWNKSTTTLKDINTFELHYVKLPINHIVIDFDIRDESGEKSLERNLAAASKFPPTYAEASKSGKGIHLHYIYTGNPEDLSRVYDDNVEIKVFTGDGALRRMLTLCNQHEISYISSGLPLKEKGAKVVSEKTISDEKHLRAIIKKGLNLHRTDVPDSMKLTNVTSTKTTIDFFDYILSEAYNSGMHYDVSDMRQAIATFAANSNNNAPYCIKKVDGMKFSSDTPSDAVPSVETDKIVLDTEVYPNFYCVCWKYLNKGTEVFKVKFPSPEYIEDLLKYPFGGYNNRAYDNHILYAIMMGYSAQSLYKLSSRLTSKDSKERGFNEARNLSDFDVFDFVTKKQSLKKWEIELGKHHQEMPIPWDQPVPEEMWDTVLEYCANDVLATEAVINARYQDYQAREILADLSGLTVNDTTRTHTTKFIFEGDKNPSLVYTDLSTIFPGYHYEIVNGRCKSFYRGEDPGEGGYVYAEPGFYTDVALLDIASMHPTSIIALNLFGKYTDKFNDILKARLAIKHHDYESASTMLGGALKPYLGSDEQADALAAALKIVINSVYGFTTATFDNPFKDPRNVDNIVAKRGALFMINLKNEVQSRGFKVAHIKTDSIKIPNATPEIIEFVTEYGKKYGYTFEHEATYEKMCLVNDAVYIAKYKGGKHDGEWTATGTQFQVPYVFKTLFSREPIVFSDLCETKSVTTAMYLDMNETKPEGEHDYVFVGRVGQFCPIKPGCGGGELLRKKDDKYSSVVGTKGYRWLESEYVKAANKADDIDRTYYAKLVDAAVDTISKYVDFERFVSNYDSFSDNMNLPESDEEELPFE